MNARKSTGLEPRATALDVLGAVLHRRVALDEVLATDDGLARLTTRDRALARMMAATTLRRLGQIDALLDACLERPLPRRAAEVSNILRLGACQLLFMRIPAHAAVDAAVRLAEGRGHAHLKRLVNAVLRRLTREGEAMVEGQDATRLNTPDWLWQSWSAAHGEDLCRRIAEAHLAEPPLDFSVKAEPERWADALGGSVLATGTVRRGQGGPVTDLPGYAEGAWWVQDVAAAMPARLMLGAFDGETADSRVIDLCAAPGGKTAQLAAAGAHVTAIERAEGRLDRLRQNLARLGLQAETVQADAATWRPDTPADGVLLDAPCSATGTIRRHPDIPWTKNPDDIARLTTLQARLLDAAAGMVRPGGVLVYAVCSLQPEEGAARIGRFLADHAEFERLPARAAEIGGLAEAVTGDGDLMTLPCYLADIGGMDAFYAARLVRRESTEHERSTA